MHAFFIPFLVAWLSKLTDERIDGLITGKQKLSDEILSGGAEAALTEMSNEELLALVSLDIQSAVES